MNANQLKAEYAQLRDNRTTVESMWQDIERYICPYRGQFFESDEDENSQDLNRHEIYDSTAIMAAKALPSAIHDSLLNPNAKWFGVRFQNDALNQDNDAMVWLEAVSERIYNALQESDFNLEIQETLYDLATYGTSVIFEQPIGSEGWEGIDFEATPMRDAYFIENNKGGVERFYRRYRWTAAQVVSKFAENTPTDIFKKNEDTPGNSERFEFFLAIFPEFNNRNADTSKQLAQEARPWQWRMVRYTGDGQDSAPTIITQGGYYENPVFVPRWAKTSESQYGNSPSYVALPAVKTLNAYRFFDLRSREKILDPAILAEERSLLGDFDLQPAGLTVVRNIAGIKPFESAANFGASNDAITRLQDDIKQMFYIDQLMLPPMGGTPASATEIQARLQQLWRLMGPTVGRLQIDLLDPIINRTFNILLRAGELPDIPAAVQEMGGQMDIEYLGMLARSQKSEEANSIIQYLGMVAELQETYPEAKLIVDVEKSFRRIAKNQGVPADLLHSQQEVQQEKERLAAQAKERMAAENAQQQGIAAQEMGAGIDAMGGPENMAAAAQAVG